MNSTNEQKFYTIKSRSEEGIYYLVKNATDTKKMVDVSHFRGKAYAHL